MNSQRPLVTTDRGSVQGIWRDGSAAFFGIPFAEPPVGALRFAAPVPRGCWEGERDAGHPGPTPQRRPLMETTTVPEPSIPGDDILLLNVFTPAPEPATPGLPVWVWIHGGGFTGGSPSSTWYDGAAFNRDGVVVVSVSYRLGFDGFGRIAGAPDNRAVLDWIAALTWVQANIHQFGGDPARVTIGGQSAGGGAALALLGIPAAQGLFNQVIGESAAIGTLSAEEADTVTASMARVLGVDATLTGFLGCSENRILDAQDVIAPFGNAPAESIIDQAVNAHVDAGLTFAPYVDGSLIPGNTEVALSVGVGTDKRLLIGCTSQEFNMIAFGAVALLTGVEPVAFLTSHGSPPAAANAYVRENGLNTALEVVGQLITDRTFRVPADRVAHLERAAPTWLYDFRWASPGLGLAMHCIELPFVWDRLGAEDVAATVGASPPHELAEEMHGAWVAFITHGDPGWTPTSANKSVGRVFDTPSSIAADPYASARLIAGL